MDEEDLAEDRESQKLVDTSESMDLDFWGKRDPSNGENDEYVDLNTTFGTSILTMY